LFFVGLWVLAESVLNTKWFIIKLPNIGFDLQPHRMLFLMCSGALIVLFVAKRDEDSRLEMSDYGLMIFFFLFYLNLLTHYLWQSTISQKDFLVTTTTWSAFITVYFTMRKISTKEVQKYLFFLTLIICVTTAIIGLYQFFINETFFIVGDQRIAFANKFRANGIFQAEYFHSYFLIIGVIWILFYKDVPIPTFTRLLLVGLFSVSIIITFHRMSYIVLGINLLVFNLVETKKAKYLTYAALGIIGLIIFGGVLDIFQLLGTTDYFLTQRLLDDTVTGRFAIYDMVISRIPDIWFLGVGSVFSNTYYQDIISTGQAYAALGTLGGIHNLYLNMGYLYGVPVVAAFLFYLFGSMRVFWKKIVTLDNEYYIPFLILVTFFLANFTNWFYLNTELGIYIAIVLGTFTTLRPNVTAPEAETDEAEDVALQLKS
jgi:hypothetical protein